MIEPVRLGEKWDESTRAQLQKFIEQTIQSLNGGLSATQNFNAKEIKAEFLAADTETTIIHGLGRIPNEFTVISKDAGSTVYESKTRKRTADRIYLLASAPVTATIRFM